MKTAKMIKASLKLLLISLVIFSLFYPLMVGGIGQIWNSESRGSLVEYKGKEVGSELIGQNFQEDQYFHSRPSSIKYEATQSASANLAPDNQALEKRVESDLDSLNQMDSEGEIPADLVTESGSALDPHISPESAYFQVERISEETGISEDEIEKIIENNTEPRFMGLYGQKRINVLKLNLKIEEVLNQ